MACVLLGLMAILSAGAALRESAAFDEIAHIGAGVSYLQKLELRLNEEHPPLAKLVATAPLVLRGVYADYDHESWTISTKFLPNAFLSEWIFGEWLLSRWNDAQPTLMWARLPMLILMLALGWMVFIFARKLGGEWGGLLALAAYVSTPAFIVFGPLVLTDVPIALAGLLALWQFAELWREPGRKTALRFSLSLAAALLTKFSSGLLFFSFAAFALSTRFLRLPGMPDDKVEQRAWRRLRWRWTLKGTLLAAVIVYCTYFLFSIHQSTDALYLVGHSDAWVPVRRLLMPPWLYLRGLLFFALTSSRPTFLFGHSYPHGVWFYFPIIFVLKSTLGFLGLLVLSIALALRSKRRTHPGERLAVVPQVYSIHWRMIWVSLLVFTAACMASRMTISIRHFTVPLVLLIVMLAPLPRLIENLTRESRAWARGAAALAVLLAASSVASMVAAYPNYFPYFNALTWSHPVYWWASDSNVDFNQALLEVKAFAVQHDQKTLNLDGYSISDPICAVPQARFWDCQRPTPDDAHQWVVVSSNMILDQHNCGWLMAYPSQMLAGGSMWAVHLPQFIPPAGSPGGPPPTSQCKTFLGMPEDPRWANIRLSRHPGLLPQACKEIEEQMRKAMEAQFGRHSQK